MRCESSLGPKEDVKKPFPQEDFRQKKHFEKQSSKICSKIVKNTICF